jgi:hypothetical protein
LNRTGGLRHEDDETGPAKLPLWTNVSLLTLLFSLYNTTF